VNFAGGHQRYRTADAPVQALARGKEDRVHSLTEYPTVLRVWWQYNSNKLIGKRSRPEYRDFGNEPDAIAFRLSFHDHILDSVSCIQRLTSQNSKARADRRPRR
jgi:hypothetical protein